MEKKCIICGKIQNVETEFYIHMKMKDKHLNKCKTCCKSQAEEREKKLRQNSNFVKQEKTRAKEKYYRLGYKDLYKPTPEKKKEIMDRYNNKYPEKRKAKGVSSKLPKKDGNELHHWSYHTEHWADIIELSIKNHNEVHTHMVYDPEYMYYRDSNNNLLDTKEKHLLYIKQFI